MWILQLTICSIFVSLSHCATWGYIPGVNGPQTSFWPDPLCQTGPKQSPIDIPRDDVTYKNGKHWLPFNMRHYKKSPNTMNLFNNGHTAQVEFTYDAGDIPRITQGGLPYNMTTGVYEEYELAQFHFHWGWYNQKGSEHTIHGRQYDMELHLVHYRKSCGNSLGEALSGPCGSNLEQDTLAVLAIMIEEGEYNPVFDDLVDSLHKIEDTDQSTSIDPFPIEKLLPRDTNQFWRLEGSLTTPNLVGGVNCPEIAVFTIFKDTITLSEHQIRKFFKLKDESGLELKNTFRPAELSGRNGREIVFADLDHKCDFDQAFKWHSSPACEIATRETEDEYDFIGAVHACIGQAYESPKSQGLIPVGRLRCLRYRMYNDDAHRVMDNHFCHRYYRVNGIKDGQGVWREYPSGQRVTFHHFPEFQMDKGDAGDTLIWDSLVNRLYIDSKRDSGYHAMCYRSEREQCFECAGFEINYECSYAGDCSHNECKCDVGYSGPACEMTPMGDDCTYPGCNMPCPEEASSSSGP